MKDINIEINVCDSTGKATCTVHPPVQVNPHTCCHSDNGGGQEPGVLGVASVFGRTGIVTAQPGDYTADQITETATRKFASPDEKASWNAKQDALISGTNIRTLFGQSLLGSGDISLTPAQMGVAAADHTHITADITDYTQKTKQLIHSSLEAGAGVTLSYNSVNEKTIISAVGGSGAGNSGYIVADRQGATAGQNHVFSIRPQNAFNLAAYALKEEAGTANQTYVVDDFNASSEPHYNATNAVIFDGSVNLYRGETYLLSQDSDFYSSEIRASGELININCNIESEIPSMASNTIPSGYIASASSVNHQTLFSAWKAFSYTDPQAWISLNAPTLANPQWLSIDLPINVNVKKYSITNRVMLGAGGVASPRTWDLLGSNDGQKWDVLHTVTDNLDNMTGSTRDFIVTSDKSYSSFRLLITDRNGSDAYVAVHQLVIASSNAILISSGNGKFYTSSNGVISEVSPPENADDFEKNGFVSSGTIPLASVSQLLPLKVNSGYQKKVIVESIPFPQIAIQKSLSPATWAQINAATLTATQTGKGKVRVAVTRDLVNWYVLRNGAWIDVGALSADTAGATKLIADGMTPAELGGITAAQWTQLFSSNNGVPDSLAFAFALDITDPVTDVATIDRLVLNVNDASSWKVQSPAEVEIRWRTDSVTFRTAAAGNYKLAYQVP
ncbi:discoidin domain-containing protein [Pectobacterium polaris]|uniref:discoidin domain-containing protein n=1 Tax=Pectobacterium polaris TaxID=2042057 RepID=UPI0023B1E38B|nr:discoidin domain-containing protein [Pectobacterium polaris]MDE8744664.1 discoidin domain-containing protein [Pectobacterium polaris]